VLFRGGARFDLAAPSSRPLIGCTKILLLGFGFHPARGGATVLKVGVQFRETERAKKFGFQVHIVWIEDGG